MDMSGHVAVLMSGGLKSSYAAFHTIRQESLPVVGVFVNHQQAEGPAQENAVIYVAQRLAIPTVNIESSEFPRVGDHYTGRNSAMVKFCAEQGATKIVMGLKYWWPSWDPHGDQNAAWAQETAKTFGIRIILPTLLLPSFMCSHLLHGAQIWTNRLV